MDFKLVSSYRPTGDQPEAIDALSRGIEDGVPYQTLLGVTGSGKTFTIANVVERVRKPTLVLSHNKTLAAQLYSEFKSFFPQNAVEYFVSYYDYYQPEAYLPTTDTYIEISSACAPRLLSSPGVATCWSSRPSPAFMAWPTRGPSKSKSCTWSAACASPATSCSAAS